MQRHRLRCTTTLLSQKRERKLLQGGDIKQEAAGTESALMGMVEDVYPQEGWGMGFRNLHAFNLAMLAKQVWRLFSNPDSVCARVLRAKHYLDGNLLKAGPKKGSSFMWQSIVVGLQTFKRWHIWRVGSGSNINTSDDHSE